MCICLFIFSICALLITLVSKIYFENKKIILLFKKIPISLIRLYLKNCDDH
jgi:hypothetical protein